MGDVDYPYIPILTFLKKHFMINYHCKKLSIFYFFIPFLLNQENLLFFFMTNLIFLNNLYYGDFF